MPMLYRRLAKSLLFFGGILQHFSFREYYGKTPFLFSFTEESMNSQRNTYIGRGKLFAFGKGRWWDEAFGFSIGLYVVNKCDNFCVTIVSGSGENLASESRANPM